MTWNGNYLLAGSAANHVESSIKSIISFIISSKGKDKAHV